MKQKLVFILMAACLLVQHSVAQTEYRQRQITMDMGLPSNSVHHIVQDHRGFIWLGTEGGLCRYNGLALQHFPIRGNSNDQNILSLSVEGPDGLYVATPKSVLRFSMVSEQYEELPLKLDGNVSAMAPDADSRLWVAVEGHGVQCYDPKDEESRHYDVPGAAGVVKHIYVDAENQVWLLLPHAEPYLCRLDQSANVFRPVPLSATVPYGSMAMLCTDDGQRWLGTWENGLQRIADDGTLQQMPAPEAGHCLHIHTLAQQDAQHLLIGSDDGLWLFDLTAHSYQLYLPLRFVHAAMTDREGGLWVGTHYGGATYLSPIAHRFDSTPGSVITHLCEDRRGRIWVASDDSGISCYQRGQLLTDFAGHEYLEHMNVHTIAMDGDDLWIGTYTQGLFVFSTVTGQLRHHEGGTAQNTLYDNNVSAIHADRKGRMWVATQGGLCRYDRATATFHRHAPFTSLPIDIDDDAEGRLWVSTQGSGLFRCDPDGLTEHYTHDDSDPSSLPDNVVNCVLIGSKNQLWVGTEEGLCRYDEQKDGFSRIRLDVPKQAVASIVEDEGVLWLSGDCGVLKYSQGKDVQRFTRHDGLLSDQFRPNACLKASDGRIYFGTIRGFNSFLPRHIKVNQVQPPIYITEVEVYNHPVSVGTWRVPVAPTHLEKLDLWHDDLVFSLAFASLSYCSPEKNIYAYMLEGFDKEWSYVGHNHRATYTNLPTGTYTFRVRATNNDGIWSTEEARLTVVVHPPLWWSLPAKIIYVLLIVGLLWGYLRLRLLMTERRHKKEMALLEAAKEEEVRNARMEFFTMIAHEIRTPVSLIIAPLESMMQKGDASEELRIIERNARRLLELVNQLLDFRKIDQQQSLDFSVQNMGRLLQSVCEGFAPALKQNGKTLKTTLPDKELTAVVDREAIVKVVSNLLSNASKYGRSKIELRCQMLPDAQHFSIEVQDDGRGIRKEDMKHLFDPFFQGKNSKAGTGVGLSIVKRLVKQHNGEVSVLSEEEQGTTFSVVLPVQQAIAADKPAAVPEPVTAVAAEPATVDTKPTMLIVDDNEDMLTFLVTSFMDKYEVLSASDGIDALKMLEDSLVAKDGTPTTTIDVVLSDWMMVEMDGPELCRRMRQNPATQRTPFVLLTAKTDSQSKVQAMDAGVDVFIEKPFNVQYLEACVNNLLRKAHL